jgi:predicted nuclease of predicted toxin-antitoxin system
MRVLLDECVPRKLKSHLPNHECASVPEAGFAGKKNGELLKLAVEAGFEVFVTVDQGIEYEQNLMSRELAIIIIRAKSNRLADLVVQVPIILSVLKSIRPGELARVGS